MVHWGLGQIAPGRKADKQTAPDGRPTDRPPPVDKAHPDIGPPLCLHGGLGFTLVLVTQADRVQIFVSLINFFPMVE